MFPKVPFIGREKEVKYIHDLAYRPNSYVLGIKGEGGIGKTSLLEYANRVLRKDVGLKALRIIDFDSNEFQIDDVSNFLIAISNNFSKESFKEFSLELSDYQLESQSYVYDFRGWKEKVSRLKQSFIHDYNAYSSTHRIVIFIDTAEKFRNLKHISTYLDEFVSNAKNTLFVISGRNERALVDWFSGLNDIQFEEINLSRFSIKESREYLHEKEKILKNTFQSNLTEKILTLARGLPILIDLSLEWLSEDVPLPWLQNFKISQFDLLVYEKKKQMEILFEKQLVAPVAKMREPLNVLTLLLSEIYPIDKNWVQVLLNISDRDASKLIEKAEAYVFVKSLSDGRITLHDEMRRMVTEYVWPEIDNDGSRRRRDSQKIVHYLNHQIEKVDDLLDS
ncbi:MAG: hypothetical protein DRG59_12570, partial [Deltaproteobacteria bacterium]